MIDQQKLEIQIAEYPVCEYAFIKPEEITFLEQVRHICESECPRYGTSWSCPPAVGTVAECKKRCRQYTWRLYFYNGGGSIRYRNMKEMRIPERIMRRSQDRSGRWWNSNVRKR